MNDSSNIWPSNVNTCPDWIVSGACMTLLKEEYIRHSCRVCDLANQCWPGMHGPSAHSIENGQSTLKEDKFTF